MKRMNIAIVALGLVFASFTSVGSAKASTPQTTLTTCTNLANKSQVALKPGQVYCPIGTAPAIWHAVSANTTTPASTGTTSLRVCTSNAPTNTYQNIRSTCPKYDTTTNYSRAVSAPVTPNIITSEAISYDSALIFLQNPSATDSPVAFYDIKNLTTGVTTRTSYAGPGLIYISGLRPTTAYSFTLTAVSVDGVATNSSTTGTIVTGSVNNTLPSTDTSITSFALNSLNPAVTGIVDNTAHTVALFVPSNVDLSHLAATFSLATGAQASIGGTTQTSGTTTNDFINPLVYTVTAQDGITTQNYTVTAYPYLAGTLGVYGAGTSFTGQLATSVDLGSIRVVFNDSNQNIWLADLSNGVLKVAPDHTISTVMPVSSMVCAIQSGSASINTTIVQPRGITGDSQGNVYVADGGSCNTISTASGSVGLSLYKIAANGTLTLLSGGNGYGTQDGSSSVAEFNSPRGIAVDSAGNVYVADKYANTVRKVDPSGNTTTIAGTGNHGDSGDGGPALNANVSYPYAVAINSSGDILVMERYSGGAIRIINHNTGVINTLAGVYVSGGSNPGCAPDNVAATGTYLYAPASISLDAADDIFIAEQGCNVIRRIDHVTGNMTIVAGNGTSGYVNGTTPTTSELASPYAVWVSPDGHTLLVGDSGNDIVRKFLLP